MTMPVVLDSHGVPVSAGEIRRIKMRASAYQAASLTHQDLATWLPGGQSAQAALSFDRDLITARVHDIARNDGWASAAMDRLVDNVIGGGWRLSAQPNTRTLGLEQDEAEDLADRIEAEWQDYVNDPAFWCDVERRRTMGGQIALAFRHRVMDGEALAVLYWKPRRGPYATCLKVLDPDRLSQPHGRMETDRMRAGVEMDEDGAAVAYHIQRHHPGEALLMGANLWDWERVPRETDWGRPVVIHAYEAGRSGQVRGAPLLTPVLRKLKQITRYDEVELQAATLNAVLAAFVESPFDHEALADSMDQKELDGYQESRLAFHEKGGIRIPGVQLGFTYPGEQVRLTAPTHPNAVFESFVRVALRNVASAAGLSYEQLTMDWSQVNYSSARAALLEVWRGLTARKSNFASQFMQPIYSAWLEEAIDTGRIQLPASAPPFEHRRSAYCAADWIGPGRGWVDPQKEAAAATIRLSNGLSTLERECAEQGLDWKLVAQQRAREMAFLKRIGLASEVQMVVVPEVEEKQEGKR